jgi:hypothetical protein
LWLSTKFKNNALELGLAQILVLVPGYFLDKLSVYAALLSGVVKTSFIHVGSYNEVVFPSELEDLELGSYLKSCVYHLSEFFGGGRGLRFKCTDKSTLFLSIYSLLKLTCSSYHL